MFSKRREVFLAKVFGLFSSVRGYNIFIIVLAQYLASIYIFAPEKRALDVILDPKLFIIIFSSSLCIAGGYIINNFYDKEKDLINRPIKSGIDQLVSQSTKLKVYFAMNFLAVSLAMLASFYAGIFFAFYIFILWFYSHKLKKKIVIGNLVAAMLVMLPFFGILMYFNTYYIGIFIHAFFLYLIILIREVIKDLENLRGDFANDYQTIPVRFGEKSSKIIVTCLVLLTLIPVYLLLNKTQIGYMVYYFYVSAGVLMLFLFRLWKSKSKFQYHQLHIVLKLLILLGVFSIMLIKPDVLVSGKTLLQDSL